MLTDLVKGNTAQDVAELPKEAFLDELHIPLDIRSGSSALSSDSGVLKVAFHRARGTPLPDEWGTSTRDLVLD